MKEMNKRILSSCSNNNNSKANCKMELIPIETLLAYIQLVTSPVDSLSHQTNKMDEHLVDLIKSRKGNNFGFLARMKPCKL